MTTERARTGDCSACGAPVALHYDDRNHKISCAAAVRRTQPLAHAAVTAPTPSGLPAADVDAHSFFGREPRGLFLV